MYRGVFAWRSTKHFFDNSPTHWVIISMRPIILLLVVEITSVCILGVSTQEH
ncbi:hypothetical protein E4U49_005412 [Claviceps purpurea]|nr:hypothetical protein E4U49_005412 [Claviceps purpurea]